MAAPPVSVTLSLGSAPYQKRLPASLWRLGMLRRVLRFGLGLAVLDPDANGSLEVVKRFPSYRVANRLLWGGWQRLPGTGRSRLPIVASSWLADRLVSRWIPPSSVFHGWPAVSLASLQAARRQGAVTVLESPMQHPRHWRRALIAECRHFGVAWRDCDGVAPMPLVRRMQREYDACERIIVPSSVARRSFAEFGYAPKTVVVWPGVDHEFFTPAVEPARPDVFRLCYVGRVELAKGLGYLLQAWKRLALSQGELVIIGQVRPEMHALLRSHSGERVKVLGVLPPDRVAACYRESSAFVLPSVNEGLAVVLLEAMASGLPVIASEASGAGDCVTEGEDGFVVPTRNVDALAEAILWCSRHREETAAMGRSARAKVERLFTLSHYEDRQISLYRSLVGTRGADAER